MTARWLSVLMVCLGACVTAAGAPASCPPMRDPGDAEKAYKHLPLLDATMTDGTILKALGLPPDLKPHHEAYGVDGSGASYEQGKFFVEITRSPSQGTVVVLSNATGTKRAWLLDESGNCRKSF